MDKNIRRTKNLQGEVTKEFVPLSLLLTHELSTTAKIIWIVLYQDAPMLPERLFSPVRLSKRLGLTPQTVRNALARLAASSWNAIIHQPNDLKRYTRDGSPKACVPERLVTDRRIGVGARVLFGVLQGTPEFRYNKGSFAYTDLERLMRRKPRAIAEDIRQLAVAGWLECFEVNERGRMYFTLRDPALAAYQHSLRRLRARVRRMPFSGAVLIQEYLASATDAEETGGGMAPEWVADPDPDATGQRERPFGKIARNSDSRPKGSDHKEREPALNYSEHPEA